LNSRERVKVILDGKIPDRLAFNFWMDRPLMAELDKTLGDNFRITYYDADVIETFPLVPWFPELKDKWVIKSTEMTSWILKHPLETADDLDQLSFPDMDDETIYTQIMSDRTNYPDKSLFALIAHPMELLVNHFGFENFFLALFDDEEKMLDVLYKISKAQVKLIENCLEKDVDVIYIAGDICTTRSEMMSHAMLEKFCFEPMRPMIEKVHSLGKKVLMHTDGNVMNILSLFVKYGIDGINPLQSNCNDKQYFADNFGDKLFVYGGIDNCFTIPEGTPQEVRQHIRDNFKILGKKGRYIASSHDIPGQVPLENIDVMVDEIKKCIYN